MNREGETEKHGSREGQRGRVRQTKNKQTKTVAKVNREGETDRKNTVAEMDREGETVREIQ